MIAEHILQLTTIASGVGYAIHVFIQRNREINQHLIEQERCHKMIVDPDTLVHTAYVQANSEYAKTIEHGLTRRNADSDMHELRGDDVIVQRVNANGDRFYWCPEKHFMGTNSKYCATCTAEREIRSRDFTHVCACPQCAAVEAHGWAGISGMHAFDDERPTEQLCLDTGLPVLQTFVIRQCNSCGYQWRQQ